MEKHEYTEGCPGCESKKAGIDHRAHSHQCRMRLEEKMERDNEGAEVLRKRNHRAQVAVEEEESKKARREAPHDAADETPPQAEVAS